MSWGILVRYFGEAVDHHTLDFVKEFGLILSVFTIGLQVRPALLMALATLATAWCSYESAAWTRRKQSAVE